MINESFLSNVKGGRNVTVADALREYHGKIEQSEQKLSYIS